MCKNRGVKRFDMIEGCEVSNWSFHYEVFLGEKPNFFVLMYYSKYNFWTSRRNFQIKDFLCLEPTTGESKLSTSKKHLVLKYKFKNRI